MGGTHARFANLVSKGEYSDFKKYRLNDFDSFSAIIEKYMNDCGLNFTTARFAVARTIIDGLISYKRFAGDPDYIIDFPAIEKQFSWHKGIYLNDLAAAAHGVCALTSDHVRTVIPAIKPQWNTHKVIVSVGTGVGHAGILEGQILETPGGHFLPITVTEEHHAVEQFIRGKKDPSLSLIMEDFVSARGLRMITEYISKQPNDTLSPDDFITHLKNHPDAVRLFFECLGMHAHNLISVMGFYGGVYIAGGVIDHLLENDLADWAAFEKYFRPNMVSVVNDRLQGCPVHYVLHTELPLLGLTTL